MDNEEKLKKPTVQGLDIPVPAGGRRSAGPRRSKSGDCVASRGGTRPGEAYITTGTVDMEERPEKGIEMEDVFRKSGKVVRTPPQIDAGREREKQGEDIKTSTPVKLESEKRERESTEKKRRTRETESEGRRDGEGSLQNELASPCDYGGMEWFLDFGENPNKKKRVETSFDITINSDKYGKIIVYDKNGERIKGNH